MVSANNQAILILILLGFEEREITQLKPRIGLASQHENQGLIEPFDFLPAHTPWLYLSLSITTRTTTLQNFYPNLLFLST